MSQNDYIKYKTLILKLLNDSPLLIPYGDFTSYNVYYLVSSIQNTKEAYNNLLPPNTVSIFNIQQPFIPSSSTISLSPYGLTGIRNTSSSITISFIPPTREIVDAYTVTAKPADGETVVQIFPGYYDTYTIYDLQAGMVYEISIIATMNTVNSAPSASILYSTILSSLSDLTISNITDSTLDISFNPPSGSIISYEVTAKSTSGNIGPQFFPPPATSYTITGLLPNVFYTISIVANNGTAYSPPFETTQSYRTLLSSPKDLTGNSISGSSIVISYTAPSIGTVYTYNISTTPSGNVIIPQNISATSYNITGLQSNVLYTISVVANAANGNYSLPAILPYRTLLQPPSSFTYTNRTSNTISVSFTEPPGSVDTYRITASSIYGDITPRVFNAPATSYTITGLQPGILYTIKIFAIIDNISSLESIPIVYSTLLLPPTNITFVEKTTRSISVSFTGSEGQVDKYKLFAMPEEGETVPKEFTQLQDKYQIDNLQSGMKYKIWAVAMNTNVTSADSDFINSTTTLSHPIDLSVNTITYASMNVSFHAPSLGSVTKYIVTATPVSGQPVVQPVINELSGNVFSTIIGGLSSNTYYNISVVASNNYTESDPLLSITPYRTLLPEPSNLQPTGRTDTSITISFDTPNDGITYTYDITTIPVSVGSSVHPNSLTNYTINGLDSGVLYTIYVKTANTADGNFSIPISTTYNTLLLPPRDLYINTATITDSSMFVSFTPPSRGTITKYIVTANAADGSYRTIDNVTTPSTLIDQLLAGMRYSISVVAYTSYTNSQPLVSDISYNTILPLPRNLIINTDTITDATIDVSFNPPSRGIITKYIVTANAANGSSRIVDNVITTSTAIDGLLAGMRYIISVVAYTSYTNSQPLVSDTSYNTILPKPRDLYVNIATITDSTIDVSFSAPSRGNITKYIVTATPQNGEPTIVDNLMSTSTAIDGLLAGMRYIISVVAYTEYTNSQPLVSDTSYNTILPVPRDLYINSATITDSSIDVSFNPPSRGSVSKYIVTANAADGSSRIMDNLVDTSTTIDQLLAGMRYTIQVVAYTSYTISFPLVTDTSYNTILPLPRDLYINTATITDSSIDVSFNAPSRGTISKYIVTANAADGSSRIINDLLTTSTTIDQLLAGMRYTIQVVAYSQYTNSQPLVSDTSYNTILPLPRDLYINSATITDSSIDVSFNAPLRGSVSKYIVTANAADGSSRTIDNVTTTPTTINGLLAGMRYTINVVAYSAYTNSQPLVSDTSYNTILPKPRDLYVNTITDSSIDVSFNPPSRGSVSKYIVTANAADGSSRTIDNVTTTPTRIDQLVAGMRYIISVVAYTEYTNSQPLVSDTSYNTILPPPRDLYINTATITDTTIDVSFNPPLLGTITKYIVTANAADGSSRTIDNLLNTSTTINQLLAGMRYIVSVVAYSAYTNSQPLVSDTSYNTILPLPRDLYINTATITDATIDVSFNAPSRGTITKYIVTANAADGSSRTIDNVTTTPTTINGLLAGMRYTINVVAYSAYTNSQPLVSDTSYNTILPPPRDLYINTATITDATIDVSFNAPSRGSVSNYTVTAHPYSGLNTKTEINGTSTTIGGLLAGMSYTISVFATNTYTNSASLASDTSYNTLLPTPTGLSVTNITDTSMNVAFNKPSRGSVYKYTVIAHPDDNNDVSFNFYTFQSLYEINGLLNNTSYTINVFAYTTYTSSLPLSSGTTKYTTLLTKPRDLIVNTNTITDTSMNISFTASSNNTVNAYEVTALSTSGNIGPQSFTGTTYTIINLIRDTLYTISVIAKNAADNYSLPLVSPSSYRTLLPQPLQLQSVGRTSTSIDISFNPPNDGITTYTYDISYSPVIAGSSVYENSITNYTINGLQSGVFYSVYVNTKNAAGNYSLPISTTDTTSLLPPSGLQAISSTPESIVVSFEETVGYAVGYIITAKPDVGNSVDASFNQYESSYEITGLQSGMKYTIRIRAKNINTISAPSTDISYNTVLPPPTNITITNISDSSIYITFTAPSSGSVTKYVITAEPVTGGTVTVEPTVTNANVNELQAGMSYTIKIIAKNDYVDSLPATIENYNTILTSPRDLIVPSNTITYESIDISFTAPSGGVLYTYEVTALSTSGNVGPQSFTGTTYTITGLSSNTYYTISVIAKKADGNTSLPLVSGSAYRTLLPPPSQLISTGNTNTSIDISFNPPNDGITTYNYNIINTSIIPDSSSNNTTDQTTYTINNLLSGVLYTIYVKTTNAEGNYSLPISRTDTTSLLPPSGLHATSSTPESIFVSFTETVGYAVGYIITAKPDVGNSVDASFNQYEPSYEITGLQSGMKYIICVNATNTNTTSAPSSDISYNTVLPNPTGLSVSNFTDSAMDVLFNKSSSGEVVQYVVTALPSYGENVVKYITVTPPGSATESITMNTLQAGMTYTINVVAVNMYTNSATLSGTGFKTILPPPRDLSVNTMTITDSSIDISFNVPLRGTITKYNVKAAAADLTYVTKDITATYTTIGDVQQLQAGMSYTIDVVAYTSYTYSVPLTSDTSYNTLLQSPSGLSVNTITDSSIDISFNAPSRGTIMKYNVKATAADLMYVTKDISGNLTSTTITGLQTDISYTIDVVAFTRYTQSNALTSGTSYTTLLQSPSGLYVNTMTITDSSMAISFNVPPNGSLYTYEVTAVVAGGNVGPQTFSGNTYTIVGLQSDTLYSISVISKTANNYSLPLLSGSSYRTLLLSPMNLQTGGTNTSITVSFDPPNNGIQYTYDISYSPFISGSSIDTNGLTNYTINGLQSGVFYSIYVKTKNEAGNYSLPISTSYITELSRPTNLSVIDNSYTSIIVSFTETAGIVDKYEITADPTEGVDVSLNFTKPFNSPYTIPGLQSGMSYSVWVRAINSIITSPISDIIPVITKLPPPTTLLVTDISYTSMFVSFTQPTSGAIIRYTLTRTSSTGSVYQNDVYATSTTLDNLQAGMSYTISVVAHTSYTSSVELAPGTIYTTTLPPPTTLNVTSITATTMNVSFTAPSAGTISKYTITATPSSGSPVIKDISGNLTSTTIPGLQGGMSYTISVVAYTDYTQSTALATGTIYTTTLPSPTTLVVTGITDASMNVSFTAPSSGTVINYRITATAGDSSVVINDISGNLTSTVITGLQAGMSYTIKVVASNSYATAAEFAPTTIYTTILPSPTTLNVSGITDVSMNVSFTAPSRGTVTNYKITATPSYGSPVITDISGNLTSTVITGLQGGMAYTIKVVASNTYATAADLAPGTIYTTILPSPTALNVSGITDASMNVSFTAPSSGTVTNYRITATPTSGSPVITDISGNLTSTVITGLQAGMAYTIKVVASNLYATAADLAPGTIYTTILQPPTFLRQNGSTANTIDISFNPPPRGTITKYTVNRTNSGTTIQKVFTPPFTIYTIDGLQIGTIYDINMFASTSYANSVLTSNITYSTTLSAPSGVTASNVTANSMTISFTPPTGTVTQYTITAVPSSGNTVTNTFNAPATSYNLTGLASYTTYTIRITAKNDYVTSVASTPITPTTIIESPSELSAPSSTGTTINITFNSPSTTIDSYKVTATNNSNLSIFVTQSIDKSLNTYTITGLTPNTTYTIQLVSVIGIYSSAPVSTTGTTLFEYIVSFSNSTRFNPANLLSVPSGLTSLSIDNTLTRITISSNNQGQLIYYNPNIATRNTFLVPSGVTSILNMAITPDGNRGIAAGWNKIPYYFTWNGTSYTTLTQTLHPANKPLGNCTGLDITADGNTIVYTDNTTKCIYFAKWNNTNYNEFTKTLDISRNTYYGLGISKNGSKIAYGVFPGNTVYVANWNGTNYGVGTAISYLGNAQPIQIRFSPGGNVIYMSTATNSVGSVQYSILYNGIYPTFKYVPTTAISANADTAGFYVSSAGVLYVMRSSQNFVTSTTPTYTPEPDTPPPTNIGAPSSTSTTINITFSAPSTAVDSYRVTAIDNSNTSIFVTQPIDNSLNTYTITNLTPSTTYTIQLVSIIGNESSSSISIIKATLAVPPPIALTGTDASFTSISILVTAPTDGITYTYDISYAPAVIGSSVTPITNTTYTINGLERDTIYTISVNSRYNTKISSSITTEYSTTTVIYNLNTWRVNDSVRSWYSVSISSTGQYELACVPGGQIYVSSDYGLNWNAKTTGNNNWISVSISSTGQYGLACGPGGQIYLSTDYGNTWNAKTTGNQNWKSVSISSDGQYGLASISYGVIYVSIDYGESWNAKTTGNQNWYSVSISSTGKYGLACVYGGLIYVSSDYGATWNAKTTYNQFWYSVSISSTGKYGLACVYDGQIYVSSDYGATWNAKTTGNQFWYSVSISSNGRYGLACVYGGQIYLSTDYGATWNTKTTGNQNWYSVSISSDGIYGLACVYDGQIYVSQAEGVVTSPSALTGTSATPTSISISFTASSSYIDEYSVTATDTSNSTNTTTQSINKSLTSYEITNLTPSKTYNIALVAKLGSYTSTTATTTSTTSAIPHPTALSVSSKTASSLTITFTTPSPSTSLDSYRVTNGTITQTFDKSLTTYTITGLTYSTTYTFQLFAIFGIYSSSSANITDITLSIPSAPPSLSVTTITSTSLTITFTAPSPSTSFDSYSVTATNNNDSNNTVTQTFSKTLTTYTITGLNSSATYTIHLFAISGTYSSASVTTTGTTTGSTNGTITMSNFNSSTVNGSYTIYSYTSVGTFNNSLSYNTPTSKTIYVIQVAGGGAGGNDQSGGGGGGGVIFSTLNLTGSDTMNFTIGAGGTRGGTNTGGGAKSNPGGNTVIASTNTNLTAIGGGAGQSYLQPGTSGGSGGGGRTGYAGTAGQGNAGGSCTTYSDATIGVYGGGGGAGGVGQTVSTGGGAGGPGAKTPASLTGFVGSVYSNYYWGGGGGGGWGGFGSAGSGAGNGGIGGGGGGASNSGGAAGVANNTAGAQINNGGNGAVGINQYGGAGGANTGGGGGGGSQAGEGFFQDGGLGGSGIIVVAVSTADINTTLTEQIYTDVTFPDSYATFQLSTTQNTDVYSNTVKTLTVSGGTTHKNGTYTVSSSSAYSSYAHPYFVFCNENTVSGPWWASGGTATTSPVIERTLSTTGYQIFNQSGYTIEGVYGGGNATGSYFTTSYTESGVSKSINGEWVQMQFPYKIKLKQFSFYPRGYGYLDRNPKSGVILGSNDGSTWVLIYNYASGTLSGYTGPFTYSITPTPTNAYNYIRFVVSECYGTTQGNFISMTKLYYTGDVYV